MKQLVLGQSTLAYVRVDFWRWRETRKILYNPGSMTYVKAMHFFTSVSNEWPASSKDHPRFFFFFMPGSHSETIFYWLHLTQFATTKKVCVSKSEVLFFSIFFSFRIFQHCRHQAGHLHLTSPKRLFNVTCKTWISEQTRLNEKRG